MQTVFEGVSIDPVGARDLDDAIWVTRDGHGWTVQVAFPRLSFRVSVGDDVDREARKRVHTVYRGNSFSVPMLPHGIVQAASLTRDVRKQVYLVTVRIGRAFKVEQVTCEIATFQSKAQLTYDAASNLVRTGSGPLGAMLQQARDLAHGLFEARRASGAIAYYDLEKGVAFDEEGAVILMTGEGHVAEMIVREFMILANASLAGWAAGEGIPILYRNHGEHKALSRDEVLAGLKDITADADVNIRKFPRLLERATIGVEPKGHYALALPAYAWFTSPLRRYADLVNQRMIEAYLTETEAPHDRDSLDAIAVDINAKLDAEADKKVEFFKKRSTQEAENLIEKGAVEGASDQEFGKVVKVLAENPDAMNEKVEAESLRRIEAGSLTPKEMVRLLLLGGRLAEAVVKRYAANPHEATAAVNYATMGLGWGTAQFEDSQGGQAHARVFLSKGSIEVAGIKHVSPQVVRLSKKAAQQAASAHLLASIAGVPMPAEEPAPETVDEPAKAKLPAIEGAAEANPKNRLLEWCQKRKMPTPIFTISQKGPSHQPTFEAVVAIQVNGRKRVSKPVQAGSRKDAEKAAATEMLALLPR